MRLRTVAKLGMVLSVVLFCTAVGFYGFAKLSLTDKSREINLFSLVPADCIGVLESDNINYFLNEFPQLNYSEELGNFQFPGLFNYVLGGLNEYTTNTAHGLSSKMSLCAASSVLCRFRVPLGTLISLVRLHPRTALSDFYSSGQEVRFL